MGVCKTPENQCSGETLREGERETARQREDRDLVSIPAVQQPRRLAAVREHRRVRSYGFSNASCKYMRLVLGHNPCRERTPVLVLHPGEAKMRCLRSLRNSLHPGVVASHREHQNWQRLRPCLTVSTSELAWWIRRRRGGLRQKSKLYSGVSAFIAWVKT